MKGRISPIPFLTTCTERIHESDSHCVLNDFLAAFPHQSATFCFCCYRTRCARLLLCIYYSLASILAVENIYRRDIFIYYIPRESYVLGNTFGSARALVRFLSSVHFKHRTRQSWGYIVRRPVWVSACYVYIGCSMLL